MKQYTVSVPTRIDLGGGTLDIWPIYLLHSHSCTINMAINLCVETTFISNDSDIISIRLNNKLQTHAVAHLNSLPSSSAFKLVNHIIKYFSPRNGFELSINIPTPPGSGLGTSSSLSLALCKCFFLASHQDVNNTDLIRLAMNLETQILQLPTGMQDYLAALHGGINAWHFGVLGWHREKIHLSDEEINKRMILCYVGKPHDSASTNWMIFKKRMEKNNNVIRSLEHIKKSTLAMHEALTSSDWKKFASALKMEWNYRKQLSSLIQTPEMKRALSIASKNGAVAAKGCGAAQGGSMLFLTAPESKNNLQNALRNAGFDVIDFHISLEGLVGTGE